MLLQAAALAKAAEDARSSVEDKLLMSQSTCDSLQDRLKAGAAELVRGNQELQRLQQEGREAREKLKTKSEVIRRQVHFMLSCCTPSSSPFFIIDIFVYPIIFIMFMMRCMYECVGGSGE